jgi:hypothetical protein
MVTWGVMVAMHVVRGRRRRAGVPVARVDVPVARAGGPAACAGGPAGRPAPPYAAALVRLLRLGSLSALVSVGARGAAERGPASTLCVFARVTCVFGPLRQSW